jgi:hypothetical protein
VCWGNGGGILRIQILREKLFEAKRAKQNTVRKRLKKLCASALTLYTNCQHNHQLVQLLIKLATYINNIRANQGLVLVTAFPEADKLRIQIVERM